MSNINLRSLSRRVVLALALGTLTAHAEPVSTKEADSRVRTIERVASTLHLRLRAARAGNDAPKQTILDDLLKQAGASLRRATASRHEVLALAGEGRDVKPRLRELLFLESRARELQKGADALEGRGTLAPDVTTVTVREAALPTEPM